MVADAGTASRGSLQSSFPATTRSALVVVSVHM